MHAHHTDLVVVVGDLPTVVLQTLQVQRKAWKSKKVRQSSLVLFINHSAPILVRSQDIKVGWSKDWEWALEKGRFGPHFSRVKAHYFQSSSHLKAFLKKTSSLDHLQNGKPIHQVWNTTWKNYRCACYTLMWNAFRQKWFNSYSLMKRLCWYHYAGWGPKHRKSKVLIKVAGLTVLPPKARGFLTRVTTRLWRGSHFYNDTMYYKNHPR